jgi:hypothetical protein
MKGDDITEWSEVVSPEKMGKSEGKRDGRNNAKILQVRDGT